MGFLASVHRTEASSQAPSSPRTEQNHTNAIQYARSYRFSRKEETDRRATKSRVVAFCAICEQTVPNWLPHPNIGPGSPFMMRVGAVGSDVKNYLCPRCQCNDRDRHLWLYMLRSGVLSQVGRGSILHIAPERHIEAKLVALAPARYVLGDLFPRQAHHQKIDCEDLPFENESFDLIISNHVLEHVSRPEAALGELFRCLKPDGYLIAQTPYVPALKRTFELDGPSTPEDAEFFYGQDDHVRLFGRDIVDYFHQVGFAGSLFPHEQVLPDVDATAFGCNRLEPFFLFTKPLTSE